MNPIPSPAAHTVTIAGQACAIGVLTVAQLRAVVRAVRVLSPVLSKAEASPLHDLSESGIDALAEALIAVSQLHEEVVWSLPLDQFVTATKDVLLAVIEANSAYLAGPVTQALDGLTAALTAALPSLPSAAPPAAGATA